MAPRFTFNKFFANFILGDLLISFCKFFMHASLIYSKSLP